MATHAITTQTFNETVKNNDIVLIDFWATWCPPCRAFGPIFEAASEKETDFYFAKVDVDANQDLAGAYGISSIPTLMITKAGKIVFQQPGALRAQDLDDLISQVRALKPEDLKETPAAGDEHLPTNI